MRRSSRAGVLLMALAFWAGMQGAAYAQAPAPGPTVVIETTKGTITIETYPSEAPKTVENFLALVKSNFYNRQHFHRAESFVIQVGDPNSKELAQQGHLGAQGQREADRRRGDQQEADAQERRRRHGARR